MNARVFRRLFNLAAAVSLALCAVTIVLWITSLFVGMDLEWRSSAATAAWTFSCSRGEMSVDRVAHIAAPGLAVGESERAWCGGRALANKSSAFHATVIQRHARFDLTAENARSAKKQNHFFAFFAFQAFSQEMRSSREK